MSQVTIYLPEALEKKLRAAARRAHKSLSAYLAGVAADVVDKKSNGWPADFQELCGSWEGEFPIPEDPPLDDDVDLD